MLVIVKKEAKDDFCISLPLIDGRSSEFDPPKFVIQIGQQMLCLGHPNAWNGADIFPGLAEME